MTATTLPLIHPIREGRSPAQIGKKGQSNHRWIVGVKLCWLITPQGQIIDWGWATANTHDQHLREVGERWTEQTKVESRPGLPQTRARAGQLALLPAWRTE